MDISKMKLAIQEIAESKGLSEEIVVEAIKEALKKAYLKSLHVVDAEDATVEVDFDLENGTLACRQLKKVVKEVNDDFLEIDIEEANEGIKGKKKKYAEGDLYPIELSSEDMTKLFAKNVAQNLTGILRQAERLALYDIYKDHIGEMITGTVERCDDRSCFINLGRAKNVELSRRDMIGDEFFKPGEPIKVYIQEVKSVNQDGKASKGPQIEVTRSSEGFLKRLFEEEIHEIFEGTVVIKGIAREAGNRSKVAVYSRMDGIDATGACIGAGGSRIQKIVNQLGNSAKDREKIDVISWSANPGLYIAEALRPANVIGVAIEEQEEGQKPSATAIVKDGQLSLAIGKKGANARLANKLTGWNIDIVEESVAIEDQIEFVSIDELRHNAEEEARIAERALQAQETTLKKAAPLSVSDITFSAEPEMKEEVVEVEEKPIIEEKPVIEEAPKAEEKVVEEKPVTPTINVKTTTTLEDLESLIEQAKNKPVKNEKKSKRPRKITEEEVERAKPAETPSAKAPSFAMPIYSEEEIEEIEAEEKEMDNYEDYDEIDDTYDDYYEE